MPYTPDLCCLLSQAFHTFRCCTALSLKPARKPNVCFAAAWFLVFILHSKNVLSAFADSPPLSVRHVFLVKHRRRRPNTRFAGAWLIMPYTPDLCCLLSQAFHTFRCCTALSLKPARKPNVCFAAAWFPFLGFTSWDPCRGQDVLFRSGMLRVLRDRWLRSHRRSCR